jgi:transcription-repair coupling factor (superfamily II helicase)
LIQTQPRRYKLDGADRLRFIVEMPDAALRIEAVAGVLRELSGKK